MAYYILVTGVTRRTTGVTIAYELRNDTPERLVDTGSIGLEFSTVGTPAVRRQAMRQNLVDVFQSLIERAGMADADFAAVDTALRGLRYP